MFEYLMPALWMRSHPDTIIDQAVRAAIACQIKYARKQDVPWGISEAAFSERDPQGVYRYRAFGVPGLAMDPHAPQNLVITPYSSFLALPFEPDAASQNLEALSKMGCLSSRGFYESCDFTPAQKPETGDYEIVRCWMAHHQGMALVALSNYLDRFSNQKWFHREPRVMSAELLLHERVVLSTPIIADLSASAEKGRPAARLRKHNSRRALSRATKRSDAASDVGHHADPQYPNSFAHRSPAGSGSVSTSSDPTTGPDDKR